MKPSLLLLPALFLAACNTKNSTDTQSNGVDGMEKYAFQDSTEHAYIEISVNVPKVDASASADQEDGNSQGEIFLAIRDTLLNKVYNQMSMMDMGDGSHAFKPYSGTERDLKSIMDYNSTATFKALSDAAEDDFKERMEYLNEDSTITDSQKEQMLQDTPCWSYYLTLDKTYQDSTMIAFNCEDDSYMGGAHGNHGGTGSMTFRLSDGKYISQFFTAEAEKGLQPLLRAGLKKYFSDNGVKVSSDKELLENLQLVGKMIPLPVRAPEIKHTGTAGSPVKDLVLTYMQYEIASYAAGMPTVTLSVKDVAPYLTDDAKTLLGVK